MLVQHDEFPCAASHQEHGLADFLDEPGQDRPCAHDHRFSVKHAEPEGKEAGPRPVARPLVALDDALAHHRAQQAVHTRFGHVQCPAQCRYANRAAGIVEVE